MAVKTYKLELYNIATDESETEVKKYTDPSSPYYGQYINPHRDDAGNLPFATAVPIGNGYFLTASHSFDFAAYARSGELYRFKSAAAYIDNVKIDKTWDHIRGWNYRNTLMDDNQISNLPWNDLTVVSTNISVPDANISPFVVFSDNTSVNNYMNKHKYLNFTGQKSGLSTGEFVNANIDGQFSTTIQTIAGDSGGPASISLVTNGTASDYVVGLLSHQNPTTNYGVFSYLKTVEFYKLMSLPKNGPVNSFLDVKPDLIIDKSGQSEKYFRGTGKKASFLIDSDRGGILLGSSTDAINTGSGTDNIIFMQSAVGENDDGATIVVSPGTDIIVGGSNNDRIVILADRLWKPSSGKPDLSSLKNNSDTIEIRGGITSTADEKGNKIGLYSPIWNKGQSYEANGYYHIQYNFEKNGENSDLVINIYAVDGSSDPQPNPHYTTQYSGNIWNSVVRIKNFKEGDFGLSFVEGLFTDNSEQAWEQLEETIPSESTSPQSSKYINNDILDDWNGMNSQISSSSYNPSDKYIQSQLDRILAIYSDGDDVNETGSINHKPTTSDDARSVGINEKQVFDLLANDTDPDIGDQIKLVSFSLQNVSGLSESDRRYLSYAFEIQNNKLNFDPSSFFQSLKTGSTAIINIQYVIEDKSGYQAVGDFILNVTGEDPPEKYGTEANDTIYGSNRRDIIYGYGGDDFISAWDENDSVFGGDGDDKIFAHEGDDLIDGGNGNDTLDGGIGNDLFYGGLGSDYHYGEDGFDTVNYSKSTSSIVVDLLNLANNSGYAKGDIFYSIEQWGLSEYNDRFVGGDNVDYVFALGGNDTLLGGRGDDWLAGGAGADTIDGQDGFDTADYTGASAAVAVDLIESANGLGDAAGDAFISIERFHLSQYDDRFVGSSANEFIYGNGGDDVLLGSDGNDWLIGGAGGDTLVGGNGYDTASYFYANTAVIIDLEMTSNSKGDALGDSFTTIEAFQLTADYDDKFVGSSADEVVFGGGGNDTLVGSDGNDFLDGEEMNDFLTGGAGADTFAFYDRGFGDDIVTDFQIGDSIELSTSAFSNFDAVYSSIAQIGANTVITLDDNNKITLIDVAADSLKSNDFHFV